jgi:hypothetical protein
MATFNNVKDLLRFIETQLPINLEKICNEIKGVLKNELLNHWYNTYMPSSYHRTYQLIESITVSKAIKVGNVWQANIYFDEDKIEPIESNFGLFPSHMNITDGASEYGGKTYGELLPMWIEEGQHSSIWSSTGIHMVERTVDWAREDNYVKNRMMELLRNKGFVCS